MAYGDNHSLVASDDFESGSISGNWENGPGDYAVMTVNTGDAEGTNAPGTWCMIGWTADAFADDQYCIIESAGQTQGITGAVVRHQGGVDERCYWGGSRSFESHWAIVEMTGGGVGFSVLASSTTSWALLSAGDTVTMEAEGTTLRTGSDRTGTDTEYVSTTDATLTGGNAGYITLEASNGNNPAESWAAGDISAGGGGTDTPQGLNWIGRGFGPQRSSSLGGELH